MCVSGVPPPVGFSFLFIIIIMVTKIFPVVASDQYAEKELSPNTLHLGPSPSIISKTAATGLIHYSEVHIARLGDLFIEKRKIVHTIIS